MTAPETPLDMTSRLTDRTKLAQEKARVLREALPWVTRWAGRTVLVKYGGHVTGEEDAPEALDAAFAADIALLRRVGVRVVVVHGGGPQISALSDRLGLQTRFVDGRRVTDPETLAVVKMVLLGQVNPRLVGLIAAAGATAIGVSGTDAGLLRVRPADPSFGAVGEVETVDTTILDGLLDNEVVPVVATIGRGPDGEERNVNADTAAGAIADALGADKLIYLTNVPGLYEHFGTGEQALLSEVAPARLREMLDSGELHTGMVPKVESMVAALAGDVDRAYLLDGRIEHALLLEIFTDEGIGTQVSRDKGSGERHA